ncbi:hypothetical protein C8J44_0531 [Sphingomonas sp. PP-CE-3A-406]|jgi:hypothetical protein|uniref:hypothetical protein n=1 Tax=Sphingomonas sp. PP-CE-3A-406 TaxID=2135659 RepID=UPI000EF8E84E|nr:hypothetical protein [Sphingomonas sp. PP-CE-3A-406]RMB55294.1 hypothetical protein C8J44_0531 [Sphingomonas sp. PP-CE-3A-406]
MAKWFPGCVGASIAACAVVSAIPARAETPRELLTQAGFVDRDRGVALARIDKAAAAAGQALSRSPNDAEAAIMQAMANGYRAKLLGNRSQAIAARRQYEALVTRYPHNAEAQAALGAWHIGVIAKLGRFVGRAVAGAQKATGFDALERSVALGGNRAMFAGLAGLLRLELDPNDVRGRALVETASRAPTPTAIDGYVRKAAMAVLVPLRAGDANATKALADKLLPFGQFATG